MFIVEELRKKFVRKLLRETLKQRLEVLPKGHLHMKTVEVFLLDAMKMVKQDCYRIVNVVVYPSFVSENHHGGVILAFEGPDETEFTIIDFVVYIR